MRERKLRLLGIEKIFPTKSERIKKEIEISRELVLETARGFIEGRFGKEINLLFSKQPYLKTIEARNVFQIVNELIKPIEEGKVVVASSFAVWPDRKPLGFTSGGLFTSYKEDYTEIGTFVGVMINSLYLPKKIIRGDKYLGIGKEKIGRIVNSICQAWLPYKVNFLDKNNSDMLLNQENFEKKVRE